MGSETKSLEFINFYLTVVDFKRKIYITTYDTIRAHCDGAAALLPFVRKITFRDVLVSRSSCAQTTLVYFIEFFTHNLPSLSPKLKLG